MSIVKPFAIIAASVWMMSVPASAQTALKAEDYLKVLGCPCRGIIKPNTPDTQAEQAADTAAPAVMQPTHRFSEMHRPVRPTQWPADSQGSANLTVQFENGSDRLTLGATRMLDELGRALSNERLEAYTFLIVGHTDSVGRRDYNQALSERRAAAVADYIASHFRVDRGRLTTAGKGQEEQLVPTDEGVAEPRNRRVQIINTEALKSSTR